MKNSRNIISDSLVRITGASARGRPRGCLRGVGAAEDSMNRRVGAAMTGAHISARPLQFPPAEPGARARRPLFRVPTYPGLPRGATMDRGAPSAPGRTAMRIDLYGLAFETPRVTFYLRTPWRSAI